MARLPARLEPLMGVHFLVTGDRAQRDQWRERVEAIKQADAVAAATDPTERQILAAPGGYRQMRQAGVLGAVYGLGLGSVWMGWLIPMYAVGHGFGWLAAASFLLPVPIAVRFARRVWERAALRTMRERLRRSSRGLARFALRRSFSAGFSAGFMLVFLQTLITWFMTPAPTLGLELFLDAYDATLAGLLFGTLSVVMAPVIGRGLPAGGSSAIKKLEEP